ncbi:hypothetical protein C8E02_0910 [Vogesella indigofera]|uniref:Uncharacterized protein n=1 Tax=Vogesella indigofera TaxID=45465 RepID=A0A495BMA0_VOGIN|nr:hypothetical protein [Vogesella indigofera]RKQ61143.1 hypothetical protein C8E02_0910 [Vogesella indigofera]
MFKIFGLAGAVLVFVAVHALTADNLVAALAGLCFLALEWWQRKTRAFYKARPVIRPVVRRPRVSKAGFNKPQPAKTASKPEQGASSAPDYKATPSDRKLLTACLGDAAKVERLIDYEIRKDPKLSRSAAVVSALDRLYMDRRAT